MQFVLEFDWSRECITPDWSLVAWAEKGEVDIIHARGKKSDSFPYIERTAEMQDPEEEALRVIAEAKAALAKKAKKNAEAKQAAKAAAEAEAVLVEVELVKARQSGRSEADQAVVRPAASLPHRPA